MKGPKILTNLTGRMYAIGDIHGCVDELMVLLEYLISDAKVTHDDQVIFLGDYIDRGFCSREVIESLVSFKARFPSTIFLKGNHEEMMLHYILDGGNKASVWLPNGGDETLDSYGFQNYTRDEIIANLPAEHFSFLKDLDRYVITDRFVFVHAGLHPGSDLLLQKDDHLYWIRNEFIKSKHSFNKIIIFGHTPFREIYLDIPYKIGIDTGLVYGNCLSAVEVGGQISLSVRAHSSKVKEEKLSL